MRNEKLTKLVCENVQKKVLDNLCGKIHYSIFHKHDEFLYRTHIGPQFYSILKESIKEMNNL